MLLGNLFLALAWVALQAEFTLANLVAGHVLGYLLLLLLVRGGVLPESPYVGKGKMAFSLTFFFLKEWVRANFRLARDVLARDHSIRPGIIAVPLEADRDSEILILSAMINLTPGSVALDVSPDRKTLYVHSMYVETAADARAEIKDGYERRILRFTR